MPNNVTLTSEEITVRNNAIREEFLTGRTLEDIGKQHGLTRERVRQIVRDFGLEPRRESLKNRDDNIQTRLVRIYEHLKETEQPITIAILLHEVNKVLPKPIKEYKVRALLKRAEIDIEVSHRFSNRQIYLAALKVKAGKSISKACDGDKYLANLVGEYCKEHGIPLRYSKWQDLSVRKEIITKLRSEGKTWFEVSEAVNKAEGVTKRSNAIYQWARVHLPELFEEEDSDAEAA